MIAAEEEALANAPELPVEAEVVVAAPEGEAEQS